LTQPTIIITGANRGVGKGITRALAKQGRHIIMACRNLHLSIESKNQIVTESGNQNIELFELDLASFASIHSFVNNLRNRKIEIAALINNAGILSNSFMKTIDGYEQTIQVNYIGQFLLTILLLPMIRKDSGRIINTSSLLYRFGSVDENIFTINEMKYHGFRAYADSKLALLLFSLELSERIRQEGISVNSVDPGVVNTDMLTMNKWFDPLANILFRPFVKSADKGAETSIYLASSPIVEKETGKYYCGKKEKKLPRRVINHPYKAELWKQTEKIVGI
jgi:NAD(P)-dependent dehydrogenase (short-subunit alcohol dehydrogenase family)